MLSKYGNGEVIRCMNILIIGNGFDLAHGLLTRYTDFLKWIKDEYELYIAMKINNYKIASRLNISIDWESNTTWPDLINRDVIIHNEFRQTEVWQCINDNQWINYFLNNSMYQKENWIDFENEISNVIRSVAEDAQNHRFDAVIEKLSNQYFNYVFTSNPQAYKKTFISKEKKQITYQELRDILVNDLNRLIRVFEIYLYEYTGLNKIKRIIPDIKNISIDKILSFNYTDTYKLLYDPHGKAEYDYIHGRLDTRDSIFSNNLVLGIDEYLPDDKKDREVEFIAFKKYYQRIYKQTGSQYKQWLNQIHNSAQTDVAANTIFGSEKYNEIPYGELRKKFPSPRHNSPENNLYIFGHSLDITDKDILRDFILNDHIYTTIFYPDREEFGRKITNLVKVIGQDELIKRTGGSAKTIEFKLQQDTVPIDESF